MKPLVDLGRSRPQFRKSKSARRRSRIEQLEARQLLAAAIFRVNSGGPEIADSPAWTADLKGSPSPYVNSVAGTNSDKTAAYTGSTPIDLSNIPSGIPSELFLSERYDWNPAPTLQYSFPVTPGQFEVRLFFAETYDQITAAQQRVFDVKVEGALKLDDFDIFAEVGGFKGVMKSFVVDADSTLDVELFKDTTLTTTQFPTIKGIEIISLDVANDPPVLTPIGNQTVVEGTTLNVPISASDPNAGDTVTLNVSNLPSFATWTNNGDGTGVITISPPLGTTGTFSDVMITATDNGDPLLSSSESITITVNPVPDTGVLYRINAGGPAIDDWETDTKENPSPYVNWNATANTNKTSSSTGTVDTSHASLPSGIPASLFNTERYDWTQQPTMQWAFPVTPGVHEVRLYFAETFSGITAAGQRVFDVSIEGNLAFDDVDVFAEVGSNKAIMKSHTVNSDGTLNIEFLNGSTQFPRVQAIEIIALGDAGTNSPPTLAAIGNKDVIAGTSQSYTITATDPDAGQTLTLTASNLPPFASFFDDGNGTGTLTISPGAGDVGTYPAPTITVTDNGVPVKSDLETFTIDVTANIEPTVVYRINAGGPAVEDWAVDTKETPSPYLNWDATANTNKTSSSSVTIDMTHGSLPSGIPAALFNSERYDWTQQPTMQWSFPVTPGTHEVRLYFAETFSEITAGGQRVFDVSIEGNLAFDDVDVFAEVGSAKALMKSYIVASDSTLNIEFINGVQFPTVRAIEIIANPANANVLSATPGSLSFGAVTPGTTAQQTVVLKNQGLAGDPDITITAASLSGSGAAAYAVAFSSALPIVLAPGQSTTATVTFAPTATLAYAASLSIAHSGVDGTTEIDLTGTGNTAQINFGKSLLSGASISKPTSLQFGPDGRLYVAQQNGLIKAFTIQKNGPSDYSVTATENISLVQQIPNHDDNGTVNPSITTRLVTGLLVKGTAANPVIYVISSDPRIGAGSSGTVLSLDTNTGVRS
ncbi:MAG: malectin domain-containing carbohydrate-binding protein, partial [Planctomycetaceae bacterium]